MVIPQNHSRVSKTDTYLNCAEVFAYRSTCLKRKYGAVIVKDGCGDLYRLQRISQRHG